MNKRPVQGRTLFSLLGVPWKLTDRSRQFIPTRLVFCMIIAFIIFRDEAVGVRVVYSLVYALLMMLTQCLHIVGHTITAKFVGAPMAANLILDTKILTYYPDDPPDLPARVHLGRTLGGPLMNAAVGLAALAFWSHFGGPILGFVTAVNLLLGVGILLPFPGMDGEVLWRELRRVN